MANRYKAKTYNHAFVCSVCQILNKYTTIRYMLRLRFADFNKDAPQSLSAYRARELEQLTEETFAEYLCIAVDIDRELENNQQERHHDSQGTQRRACEAM